jgi:ubiquinone/menaquinone biosynthesis C-methylase UbiE
VALSQTEERLRKHNKLVNCTLRKLAAERLVYANNTFDIALGFAVLHHLDLEKAMPELYRVLKPSGVAYFAEPLGSNPILQLFRKLTPKYRTIDERPIVLGEFRGYINKFNSFSHEEFYLSAMFPLLLAYIPIMKIYTEKLVNIFLRIDSKIIKTFPKLAPFSWYSIITLRK